MAIWSIETARQFCDEAYSDYGQWDAKGRQALEQLELAIAMLRVEREKTAKD